MWNSDERRLPDWVEDAYDHLAARMHDCEDRISRDDAVTILASNGNLALGVSESKFAIEQLLDRGYLYEVEGVLFVTDTDLKQADPSDAIA
jgi:hypothetical protein